MKSFWVFMLICSCLQGSAFSQELEEIIYAYEHLESRINPSQYIVDTNPTIDSNGITSYSRALVVSDSNQGAFANFYYSGSREFDFSLEKPLSTLTGYWDNANLYYEGQEPVAVSEFQFSPPIQDNAHYHLRYELFVFSVKSRIDEPVKISQWISGYKDLIAACRT